MDVCAIYSKHVENCSQYYTHTHTHNISNTIDQNTKYIIYILTALQMVLNMFDVIVVVYYDNTPTHTHTSKILYIFVNQTRLMQLF